MTHLIRHFLRRMLLPYLPIICAIIGIVCPFVGWQVSNEPEDLFPPFIIVVLVDVGLVVLVFYEAEEFDMILPFRRSTVFIAKSLAALITVFLYTAPVGAGIVAFNFLVGRDQEREMITLWARLSLVLTALLLVAIGILISLRRVQRRMELALVLGAVGGGGLFLIPAVTKWDWIEQVLALDVGCLAWLLGAYLFERLELSPGGEGVIPPVKDGTQPRETVAYQPAPAKSFLLSGSIRQALLSNLPPFARFMGCALWFTWWYPLILLIVAGFSLWSVTNCAFVLFPFCLLQSYPLLFNEAGKRCLTFVQRRTLLRCIMAPLVVAPVVVAGVMAVGGGSPDMILPGLTAVLIIVVSAWAVLPSGWEYSRPTILLVRHMLPTLFAISVLFGAPGLSCVAASQFLHHKSVSDIARSLGVNLSFLCCPIVLAIAFFWRRCERKFEHFEPTGTPAWPIQFLLHRQTTDGKRWN